MRWREESWTALSPRCFLQEYSLFLEPLSIPVQFSFPLLTLPFDFDFETVFRYVPLAVLELTV